MTGGECGILGAAGNQCVQVALQRCNTDGRDCGESNHQRQAAHIGCHHHAHSSQGGQHIAPDVQFIHTAHLLDHIGQNRKGNNHGDVDAQRQVTEQFLVTQDVLGVVSTHANDGSVELGQNVAAGDDNIVLVLQKDLEGLQEGQLVLLFSLLLHLLIRFGKLFHGEHRDGIGNQAKKGIDDGDHSPGVGPTAEPVHCKNGHSLNDDLGGKGKDKAERTDLDTLAGISGDQCRKRGVGNVVGGEEYCVKKRVRKEEEDILCRLIPAGGNGEAGNKGDGAADIGPEHPGARLTHLRVGLIDHSAEEEIGNAVKNFGSGNQSTDNTHAQSDRIGQIDHHERGQQCVHAVACNVAGAVSDLVIPFQILFLLHGDSPLHHFVGLIISVRG